MEEGEKQTQRFRERKRGKRRVRDKEGQSRLVWKRLNGPG